jgi:hypothetical protein
MEQPMKKTMFALSLILFAFSGFAQSSSAFQLATNEAFVIMNGLPLYQEQGGTLKWKENLTIGDKVQVKGKIQKIKLEGKERDFLKIVAPSGAEGFARAPYLVQKATLAVVRADKAVVYTEPRDVKITSKSISQQTIVAALTEGSSSSFAKVLCYDAAQDAYFTDPVFVAAEDLTYAEADVNATILFATASATKNKDIRANLLKVIEKRYSSSIFFDRIRAALEPSAASQAPAASAAPSKPVVAKQGKFIVNDDKVNVRAQPDEVNGEVVAQLDKDAVVETVEATARAYTVAGQTGLWYRIVEPSGWVFGVFLDPAE